jgi:hypothetical protein
MKFGECGPPLLYHLPVGKNPGKVCCCVRVNEDRNTSRGVPAKIKSNSGKEILHNYDTPPR